MVRGGQSGKDESYMQRMNRSLTRLSVIAMKQQKKFHIESHKVMSKETS